MNSFIVEYPFQAVSPNTVTLEVRASTYVFWGDTTQFITEAMTKRPQLKMGPYFSPLCCAEVGKPSARWVALFCVWSEDLGSLALWVSHSHRRPSVARPHEVCV